MLDVLNLDGLEPLARERLSQMAYDYIAGGSGDEETLRENQAAFRRIQLLPRVLVNVKQRNHQTTVLGTEISFPVLVAPMGFHRLAHPDGELATARGTAAAETIFVASTAANYPLETIAQTGDAPRWFQLYVYRDRAVTQALVERAAQAGYKALCVTVDTPLVGRRERDMRNSFTLPDGLQMANFVDTVAANVPQAYKDSGLAAYIFSLWEPSFSWADLEWLRSISPLPLVLKGIMSPEDARLAVEHGADAIIVSNHGGRQLDTVPATISVLPAVADAVAGKIEVLLDGGVRRGTDVLKALALGARAVLLGRPIIWGLALEGERGVTMVLDLLRTELDLAMALSGCTDARNVDQALVYKG